MNVKEFDMKKNTDQLVPDTYYHIYNRGINGENIFKSERNYFFFLEQFEKYINPVASTHAYCLLKNYFHFLIRTHSEDHLKSVFPLKEKYESNKILSLQFSHLFNSYSQALNKSQNRTGGLFETPFRRIAIKDEFYLLQLVYYIHFNPQKHHFTDDFKTYPYSSYIAYMNGSGKLLERSTIIELLGGQDKFITHHATLNDELFKKSDKIFIDFEPENTDRILTLTGF